MNNILYNIDCMEYMKDIPDNYFDLAIVDPFYGKDCNLEGGSSKTGKNGWSGKMEKGSILNIIPNKEYFSELFRISKDQIICGGNYFSQYLYSSQGWIVWNKGQRNFSLADGELIWTSFDRALRIFDYSRANANFKENKIHAFQKPVALYKWLLTNYAKPGDKLFDSHSGSGSFRIAAYDMGFDLISCELDADYSLDNKARYNRHIQQINLFKPEEIQEKIYRQGELNDR